MVIQRKILTKKRFLLIVIILIPAFIYHGLRKICPKKVEELGRGGQSIIFSCDGEILKVYKRPWTVDLEQMDKKLKVLNKFDFVPRTEQFFFFGFKQQQVIGRKTRKFTPLQFEELGRKIAKIHTTVNVELRKPTSCDQNTGKVVIYFFVFKYLFVPWFILLKQLTVSYFFQKSLNIYNLMYIKSRTSKRKNC